MRPRPPARTRPFLLNVPRKDLQQANLVMGFPAPDHRSRTVPPPTC